MADRSSSFPVEIEISSNHSTKKTEHKTKRSSCYDFILYNSEKVHCEHVLIIDFLYTWKNLWTFYVLAYISGNARNTI